MYSGPRGTAWRAAREEKCVRRATEGASGVGGREDVEMFLEAEVGAMEDVSSSTKSVSLNGGRGSDGGMDVF